MSWIPREYRAWPTPAVIERLEDEWRDEIGWDKKPTKERYRIPTGELRLYVGDILHERQFRDGATRKAEDQLNDVFVAATWAA